MNTGKKHVVISQEEYNGLKEINQSITNEIVNLEKRELKKSENAMRDVCES